MTPDVFEDTRNPSIPLPRRYPGGEQWGFLGARNGPADGCMRVCSGAASCCSYAINVAEPLCIVCTEEQLVCRGVHMSKTDCCGSRLNVDEVHGRGGNARDVA
jgi:hypothetical protein